MNRASLSQQKKAENNSGSAMEAVDRHAQYEPLMKQRYDESGDSSSSPADFDGQRGAGQKTKEKKSKKRKKPQGTVNATDPTQLLGGVGDYEVQQQLQMCDRVELIENSWKWQASFVINIFTQSLALWTSLPVTWYIISAQLQYADAIRTVTWIVSLFAFGDGLGLYLGQKLYGSLSARQTLNLAIIFSIIASLIYALAGSTAIYEESSSSIFKQLCTARVIQGICHGLTYLTQQAYIGQVLPKDKNNALQLRQSRAFVMGVPFAVLLAYISSLCSFTLGSLQVTQLSAPGLILCLTFIMQLFINFLLFDEIPISHRRLPLGRTSSSQVDNTQLTPYIASDGAHRVEEDQPPTSGGANHPNRYISTTNVNIQHLLMSNYSDLHNQMMVSYQSHHSGNDLTASLPPQNDPELQQDPGMATRYIENRNLQQVAILTENEMRVLCTLPPNQSGILISILIAFTYCSTLSMFEIALMPLIVQADKEEVTTMGEHHGYPLLACISVTACVSYFVFRRFITENQRGGLTSQLSDRSFIFMSLVLGIVGSALLINFQTMGAISSLAFIILAISLVIGIKSTMDLYAKIVGVSSLLDERGDNQSLEQMGQSQSRRYSVGWYLALAVTCLVIFRVLVPHFTSYLVLHGGASAIFWQILIFDSLALLIYLCRLDSMQPHQSYLILKQREMICTGLDDKDLRLLDTIEHTLQSPFDPAGLHSSNRNAPYNTYQSGLFFNASMQDRDPNNSL